MFLRDGVYGLNIFSAIIRCYRDARSCHVFCYCIDNSANNRGTTNSVSGKNNTGSLGSISAQGSNVSGSISNQTDNRGATNTVKGSGNTANLGSSNRRIA